MINDVRTEGPRAWPQYKNPCVNLFSVWRFSTCSGVGGGLVVVGSGGGVVVLLVVPTHHTGHTKPRQATILLATQCQICMNMVRTKTCFR